jgi:hypothetical protein
MLRTVVGLAACAAVGVLLAQSWLPFSGGFAGAAVLVAAAARLRRHWQILRAAPETAERSALLSGAGTLLCLGFFAAKLAIIGADADLASRAARAMAAELWTLAGASVLAQWIARAPDALRDERDAAIASNALAGACRLLLAAQLALVAWFGLSGAGASVRSPVLLVHLLICSWMIAHAFYDLSCMHAYARSRSSLHEPA